jgi:Rad3-related DNA helicase
MNRVLQAAGRVIRREEDRGVVVLIDDRFSEPLYRRLMPNHWRGLKYVGDLKSLSHLLGRFWGGRDE